MNELFAMMGKVTAAPTPCSPFSVHQSAICAMLQWVQTAIEVLVGLDELNAQWEKKAIALLMIGLAFGGWLRASSAPASAKNRGSCSMGSESFARRDGRCS
jgi:hypothetical protein